MRGMLVREACAALGLLLSSCSEPAGTRYRLISVAPGDLRTNVQVDELRVVLTNAGSYAVGGDPALDTVPDGVSLRTWPDDVAVAATVERVDGTAADPNSVYFQVHPTAPLARRWYAVALDMRVMSPDLVANDDSPDDLPGEIPGRGVSRVVHRFYPGSLPLFVASAGYDVEHDQTRISVFASESLTLSPGTSLSSTVQIGTDRSSGCAYATNGDVAAELRSGRVDFVCDGGPPTTVTLTFSPGLLSLTGEPLRDVAGRDSGVVTWTPSANDAYSPRVVAPAFFASTNAAAAMP